MSHPLRFSRLHERGLFVMPNAWDIGSAKILEAAGFDAIATSSAGIAFSLGYRDSDPRFSAAQVLDSLAQIVRAVNVPVSADLEAGLGETPEDVKATFARAIQLGCAGGSIEDIRDYSVRGHFNLHSLPDALERVRAAREAIDRSGTQFVLTARTECYLVGHPRPLEEALERLTAFRDAGADCVFAPGISTVSDLAVLVSELQCAVSVLPVGELMQLPTAHLADMGVRRISTGSGIARAAYTLVRNAAVALHSGQLDIAKGAMTGDEFDELFDA